MRNSMVNFLLLSYDKTMRAQIDQEMVVTVNFYVEGMSKVNEMDMDYEMNIFFRQVKTLRLNWWPAGIVIEWNC